MLMLETQDILYIVLAFCALWITLFICWFVYQVASIIKNVNDVLKDVRYQIEKVEQVLNGIKAKFETGTGHLSSLAEDIKKATSKWK